MTEVMLHVDRWRVNRRWFSAALQSLYLAGLQERGCHNETAPDSSRLARRCETTPTTVPITVPTLASNFMSAGPKVSVSTARYLSSSFPMSSIAIVVCRALACVLQRK